MRLILRYVEASATRIRLTAYLGGLALLAIAAAAVFLSPNIDLSIAPPHGGASHPALRLRLSCGFYTRLSRLICVMDEGADKDA